LSESVIDLQEKNRILVIDDDESIREVLSILLESEGYIVDTAENGEQAIEKTIQNFYNLAIVDYRLPDAEGTFLIKKFKETNPKMVKIMLTGYPSTKNAIDAVNNHAHAFMQKPIDPASLVSKVEELLQMQQEEKAYSEDRVAEYIQTRFIELKSKMPARQ
jgi:DNA-binding NtrC family response regulator